MVPSSVANRNSALPVLLPSGLFVTVSTNCARALALKTAPVGAPASETIRPCFSSRHRLFNSVDLSTPLSASHHGLVGLEVSPQGFTRSGLLVFVARLVWK